MTFGAIRKQVKDDQVWFRLGDACQYLKCDKAKAIKMLALVPSMGRTMAEHTGKYHTVNAKYVTGRFVLLLAAEYAPGIPIKHVRDEVRAAEEAMAV